MTLKVLRDNFINCLDGLYPSEEIDSFFKLLTEKFIGLNSLEIALNRKLPISEEVAEKFSKALFRLKEFEPIQYVLGETEFYGLRFRVNKHTLIPRPETEELVEWVVDDLKILESSANSNESLGLLDIGTGSGCIAISIAENIRNVKVSALDISEEALQIAKQNALKNKVTVDFLQHDIVSKRVVDRQFNIIVSNPPYVRESEKDSMQQNVLEHEPAIALFVKNNDPLLFYRAIIRFAQNHLKDDGSVYFEINEYLSKDLIALLKTEGFHAIVLKKDIFGKDRMIRCIRNE